MDVKLLNIILKNVRFGKFEWNFVVVNNFMNESIYMMNGCIKINDNFN